MRLGRWILPIVASLILVACSRPVSYNQTIYVFGTLVDITLWGMPREKAREHVASLASRFRQMHQDWHAWQPGALRELNAAIEQGSSVAVQDDLRLLIERATQLQQRSGGLFNPAIGKLIALWGFHKDDPLDGRPPPHAHEIDALVSSNPTMNDLIMENGEVSSRNRNVRLDFGGFAKGFAVDWAIEELRRQGVANAIVNTGGDLRAIGDKDGKPWRIGVRHPQGEGVLAAIETVGDESVFTSGNYERYNEHQGVRYAHIIDPRSGRPVAGITSVTVIHDNGTEADAAATALVVAGVEEWPRVARSMGILHVMLVEENGTVHLSPSMVKRVEFQGEKPPITVTSIRGK